MAKTVSLEMARRLKEAGLEWEPEIGDFRYWPDDIEVAKRGCKNITADVVTARNMNSAILWGERDEYFGRFLYAPSLSDLLEWLEGKKYDWNLDLADKKYRETRYELFLYIGEEFVWNFGADTPEDAAALAVEWVLKEGK